MTKFAVHTKDNHPDHAHDILTKVEGSYGFVPNLLGIMSESPEVAETYMFMANALKNTNFTDEELHVVWFTVNVFHDCNYCMAAHSAIATMDKIPATTIEAARTNADYDDPRLQALKTFTIKMLEGRGWVDGTVVEAFLAAGFTNRTVLDVILTISHKTLSNYINHVAQTPVDKAFAPFAWAPNAIAAE